MILRSPYVLKCLYIHLLFQSFFKTFFLLKDHILLLLDLFVIHTFVAITNRIIFLNYRLPMADVQKLFWGVW